MTAPTSSPPSEVGAVKRPDDEVGDAGPLGEDSSDRLARLHEIMERTAEVMAMNGPGRLRR